jgi:GntR family transcriptional regulator
MIDLKSFPDLDKNDYKPMYIQLGEILADYINANEIDPETPFASEKELMERFDISRTTARLALQRLEAADLVQRIRGKGTFLAENGFKKHIGDLFQSIEERLAQHGFKVTNILLEHKVILPLKKWAGELGLSEGVQACLIRRLKMIDDEPIGIEVRLIPLELADCLKEADFANNPIFNLVNSVTDFRIHRISYHVDSRQVSEMEAEELKVPIGTPVLVRKGTYHNKAEKPVMVSQMIFLTNHFDLEFIYKKEGENWMVVKAV